MAEFQENLIKGTDYFFNGTYEKVQGRIVPSPDELAFGKYGKEVELAMLFIDIKESTKIVDAFRLETAARMYQSFLRAVTLISLKNNGEIRSFNGDGVLVTFYGDSKCNNAVRSALQMMEFVNSVLKPKLKSYFINNKQAQNLVFDCGIGIDVGNIFAVRGGIKGDNNNDLVWVGNPTNYAVKLSAQSKVQIPSNVSSIPTTKIYNIHITNRVYSKLKPELKTIKNGIFSVNVWNRQPSMLGGLLPGSLATTTIYRTDKTIPF
ncbi:MAG: adenylate/guanylate cyclase domain-containing protein [Candidatus Colwellbacteria bacterium]|nr:adenylate/guanylate cyclase domain-containing protein [Candidatus Colwellbacteria bacterium]